MNQIIYLLKHGETVFNIQGRYQGEPDSSLTAEGIGQVKNISKLLKMVIKDSGEWEIISSPLGRAMQSTEIICETACLAPFCAGSMRMDSDYGYIHPHLLKVRLHGKQSTA